MAEQHTIISRHVGKIGVLVKGENVEVNFEKKDGKGVAKVDAAVRDALLKIPGYAKPMSKASTKKEAVKTETPSTASIEELGNKEVVETVEGGSENQETVSHDQDDDTSEGAGSSEDGDENQNGDADVLSKERYAAIKNLNELKGLLPACDSQELLMELIVAESEGKDTRTTYTKEMQDRLDTLQASQ